MHKFLKSIFIAISTLVVSTAIGAMVDAGAAFVGRMDASAADAAADLAIEYNSISLI